MVWENVPGAFSSNKGKDFQAVLTEIVRIAEADAPDVPLPEKGKWSKSGILLGDGFSIAWRLHDAQFWGVPQRRKRIALVADFGGLGAPEILFEREGVQRNPEQGSEEREKTPGTSEEGSDEAGGSA
jgi:DNA (cytosine-5)-methyltransferase 1